MKRALLSISALSIFLPLCTHAQLRISEIMYDLAEGSDSGREWVEVYNTSSEGVSLTNYRFVESGTKHEIKLAGVSMLPPQSYAVIVDNPAKFGADWPQYEGLIFDTAFSLSNNGETIALVSTAGELIDSVVYTSASGNGTGDSLQREPTQGTVFEAGIPTPGKAIPVTGLTQTPVSQKVSLKKLIAKKGQVAAITIPIIEGEPIVVEVQNSTQESSPTSTPSQGTLWWWMAPLILGCIGSGGIVVARHFKKDEWEIEEMPESS